MYITYPILSTYYCGLSTFYCGLLFFKNLTVPWSSRRRRKEGNLFWGLSQYYGVYPVRPHLQYSFLILFSMHSKNNDPFRSTFGFLRSWKQRLFNISIFLKPFLLHFTHISVLNILVKVGVSRIAQLSRAEIKCLA